MLSRSLLRLHVQASSRRTLASLTASTTITSSRTSPISRQLRITSANTLLVSRRRNYSTPMAAPTDTAADEVANTTGITPNSISQVLKDKLDAEHVDIQDISGGCGASFTALIVSSQFNGKTALARHRLVNSALKKEIAAIHAWTPRCLTPEQWQKERGGS